jgi:SAM-dependent methyltransferase
MTLEQQVASHYGRADIVDGILQVVAQSGKDPARPTLADLAPLDQFHVRGTIATEELGKALGLAAGEHVLDIGSGIGGPARQLAARHDCRITGIDLTQSFVDAATDLAQRVGMADQVSFRVANALDLPFPAASFDAAYSQHVAMNIADKAGLYREIARVLKPGARFGLNDIVQGPGGPAIYPLPWAREAATSFLVTAAGLRRLLADAGFTITAERDTSAAGRAFQETALAKAAAPNPPPGRHLLMPQFATVVGNLVRCLAEDRVAIVELIATRA